jgi:transcriptional regulator with XRE-family HTH domain
METARSLLGDLLRQARLQSKHRSQERLARVVGKERTTITHAELGDKVPSSEVLEDILAQCGITAIAADAIRGIHRLARREGGDGEPVKTWFVGWVDAEAAAWRITFWNPGAVPGLLQTKDYAYHTFRVYGLGHEQAEAATAARMERQKILERDTPPTVVAIIDEVVLQRQLGTREVMAGQCQKLLDASEHPSVIIQVVRGASAGIGGALALAEGPRGSVLLSGSVLEDTVTADGSQVRAASVIVDAVRGAAVTTADSRVIIGESHQRWTA